MWAPAVVAVAVVSAVVFIPPALAPASDTAAPGAVRILPLGDSITYGHEYGSYRLPLWEMLVEDNGFSIDFVGSEDDGPRGLPDRNHEGHSGWRIDEIEPEAAGWVEEHNPDIVLLHIGTNDLIQGASAEEMAKRLDATLDALFTTGPDMTVITASLIPLDRPNSHWRAYNAAVEDLVAEYRLQGRDAVFADIAGSGIGGREDIPDGVHPNPRGYAKMAEVWYPLVVAAIERRTGDPVDATREGRPELGSSTRARSGPR